MNDERMTKLHEATAELETAIEQAEYALDGIESVIEAEQAHNEAVERDASEQIAVGDEYDLVINPNKKGDSDDLMVWHNGIAGFVHPAGRDLSVGDYIHVVVSEVDDTAFQCIAREKLNSDDGD